MKFGYYPGCSLESTAREYEKSLKKAFSFLGIQTEELEDWTCCGTSSRISPDALTGDLLSLRNLVSAEKKGFTNLLVPCAACFSRLKTASYNYNKQNELKIAAKEIFGSDYKNSIEIINPLGVLSAPEALKKIREKVKKDIGFVRVVPYYGCLLTRPPKIMNFDSAENPVSMDDVLDAAGVQVIDWSYKTECCGASFSLTRTDIVLELSAKILKEAKKAGADAVAVACPLCHANLDMRQAEIEKKSNEKIELPILYYSQILGMAFGASPDELGLSMHMVSVEKLLERV